MKKVKNTITRKEFVKGNFEGFVAYGKRQDHPISKFLRENYQFAFKIEEIARKVKMNKSTVRSMLTELKKDKLVVHKTPYFAWKKK